MSTAERDDMVRQAIVAWREAERILQRYVQDAAAAYEEGSDAEACWQRIRMARTDAQAAYHWMVYLTRAQPVAEPPVDISRAAANVAGVEFLHVDDVPQEPGQ